MAGTKAGGKQAAKTNKAKYDAVYIAKYGMGFYEYIGQQGGSAIHTKPRGFASMSREKRGEAGRKGGTISRRGRE